MEADRRPGPVITVVARWAATATAAAPLDPHDTPCDALTVGALEAQAHCAALRGTAAAAIHTRAAGAWSVAPGCGASSEGDAHWFPRSHSTSALFPFLQTKNVKHIQITNYCYYY